MTARERLLEMLRDYEENWNSEDFENSMKDYDLAVIGTEELERLRETATLARTAVSAWDWLPPKEGDDTPEEDRVYALLMGLFSLAWYALHPETPLEDRHGHIEAGRLAARKP